MEAIKAIKGRRSVRTFDTSREVSEETVRTLLDAAMSAPSAVNEQPWHFVVLRDKAIQAQLPTVNPYAAMATTAPVVIIVCGEPALEHPMAKGMWVQDCSAATENLLVAAHALGLGAVWTAIAPIPERIDGIRKLIHAPEGIVPLAAIPIGYPAQQQAQERPSRFRQDRFHVNGW